MALIYPYRPLRLRAPAIALGGRATRPKPLVDISLAGPRATRVVVALLDTGADDTVFPERLAAQVGIDLSGAPEAESGGYAGSPVARLRYAQVRLRLATASEQRDWPAMVAFPA